MVMGLDTFREYFKGFESCYALIGGAACDYWLSRVGLQARVTKDLDLVIIIESLDSNFVSRFWEFTRRGGYVAYTDKQSQNHYFRFENPTASGYPEMLELFSRRPDAIYPAFPGAYTVIPVDAGIASLSAILLDDEYYNFILATLEHHEDLSLISAAGLIPLKARAFLDLSERKASGQDIDSRDIVKHKNDIYRLALILGEEPLPAVTESIRNDLKGFFDLVPVSAIDLSVLRKETRFRLPIDGEALMSRINSVYGL